ncbi:MAG: uroporphyrinogen decarboxylase family protein [Phycisphaerae bacterium]
MPVNDLVLRASRGERTERTPVWLMRQAGRFDPEYRELRRRADLPLEKLFRHPDLAAEISLLPKRLGVDAIIVFQDILTPLAPMGAEFVFRPGPMLHNPMHTAAELAKLRPFDVATKLDFVPRTLRLIREALGGELPLLGFAGAPLTLASFIIEGGSPRADGRRTREFMRDEPDSLHHLLDRLADMTADYLTLQIETGVDAVQLFESSANFLSFDEYRRFAHPYQVKVLARIRGRVPTILFVKNRPFIELMARSGADVLSIGSCVDLAEAKAWTGERVALQGNVDHRVVAAGSLEEIDRAVRHCIVAGGHTGHILNLDNGLDKDTPVENVLRVIETAAETVAPVEPDAANTR